MNPALHRIFAGVALFALVGTRAPSAQASPLAPAWYRSIQNPELQRCIDRALAENPSLQSASLRIASAKTTTKEMLTPLLPQVSGELSVSSGPMRSLGFQFGGRPQQGQAAPELPLLYAMGSARLRASLDIDLAGRATLNRKSAKLDLQREQTQTQDQQEALVLQVLSAYLDASAAKAQLHTLNGQVQTLQALLETTARRLELGDKSAVDVLNQKQQLARVKAQIPLAKLQLEAFVHQLARLQGLDPTKPQPVPNASLDPAPWLALTPAPDTDPLHQRSVIAAKQGLASARLRETRAKRAWAPTLRVNAEAGVQGRYLGSFFSQGYWSMGANLSVPLYQGGLVVNQREQARLQSAQRQVQLTQAQLDAKQRWADLQSQLRLRKANLSALQAQHQAAKLAANETKRRYLGGTSNYLEVLSALNTLTGVELALVTARRDLIATALSLRSFAANASSPSKGPA